MFIWLAAVDLTMMLFVKLLHMGIWCVFCVCVLEIALLLALIVCLIFYNNISSPYPYRIWLSIQKKKKDSSLK